MKLFFFFSFSFFFFSLFSLFSYSRTFSSDIFPRYLQPPNRWMHAELDSPELLAICLKQVRGLNKVRLIDAHFLWTEPHSKRLRIKLTVQKEVYFPFLMKLLCLRLTSVITNFTRIIFMFLYLPLILSLYFFFFFLIGFRKVYPGLILQQSFEIEFVVVWTQSPEVAASFTAHTWKAAVQVRQKVFLLTCILLFLLLLLLLLFCLSMN